MMYIFHNFNMCLFLNANNVTWELWYCDNVTKLENLKNWQISKQTKIWNLVVSKPENNTFRFKTATEKKCQIGRKKTHSFFAETKLEVEQIKKKIEEKLIKPLFIEKSIIFLKKKETTINFQVKN